MLDFNQISSMPELQRTDADVSLFFLTAPGISYSPPVEDPWYSAHKPGTVLTAPQSNGTGKVQTFEQDEPASVLGCITKSQICNPNGANGSNCLPMAGYYHNVLRLSSLWENPDNDTSKMLDYFQYALGNYMIPLDRVIYIAGNAALSARQNLSVFSRLPDNQWENEVLLWTSASVAGLQDMFIGMATGLRGLPEGYGAEPENEVIWNVCRNQVRETWQDRPIWEAHDDSVS
jgi:hypothetical protein